MSEDDQRLMALAQLKQLPPDQWLSTIWQWLCEGDRCQSDFAEMMLLRQGAKAVPGLIRQAYQRRKDTNRCERLLEVVGRIGAPLNLPSLKGLLLLARDGDRWVTYTALGLLQELWAASFRELCREWDQA